MIGEFFFVCFSKNSLEQLVEAADLEKSKAERNQATGLTGGFD